VSSINRTCSLWIECVLFFPPMFAPACAFSQNAKKKIQNILEKKIGCFWCATCAGESSVLKTEKFKKFKNWAAAAGGGGGV